jgi:hypothetical protein
VRTDGQTDRQAPRALVRAAGPSASAPALQFIPESTTMGGRGGGEEEGVVDGGRHHLRHEQRVNVFGGEEEDRDEGWRRWSVLVATVWIQALTGTNFDFSAYSSALKSSLGVSQEALNCLATASDLGKALGWSSGLALLHMPLHAVLMLSAAMGLAAYAAQYYCLVFAGGPAAGASSSVAVPYPLVRTCASSSLCVSSCLTALICLYYVVIVFSFATLPLR